MVRLHSCFLAPKYSDTFSTWLVSLVHRQEPKVFCFFKKFYLFFYFWLCWVCFCARAFSSCGERGPLFIAVRGPLTIVASLVAEHRLQMSRLSSCGSRAQLLRGMWDLPRPGLEPVSPELAGRLSTTAPPGKPQRVRKFLSRVVQNSAYKISPARSTFPQRIYQVCLYAEFLR